MILAWLESHLWPAAKPQWLSCTFMWGPLDGEPETVSRYDVELGVCQRATLGGPIDEENGSVVAAFRKYLVEVPR